ncbi:hypothetical protein LCGC14_0820890 [marine sediment metagenome]|uniref:formate--tetrahydrofolate ligase n=1 Tax=marine sediment metagenome TaxID=412755 RepID=A0A0F9PIU8_9ZZZZ
MTVKTKVPSDIEIAQAAKMEPIIDIAKKIGLEEDDLELYGKYKAKISYDVWERVKGNPDGKLILTTAITPTPAGEGKSTTTVGLGQALSAHLGKNAMIALREPSLGPCFGVKGGAAGGGYSQIVPMEDINLHFTGDLHAISTAHNLLSAMLDNHIIKGNELDIDVNSVTWRRVVDLNDRALRDIIVGLGGSANGVPRETGFDITVASEIMAILCLADDIDDLKARFAKIIIAYNHAGEPITAGDIKAQGAMAALMKDAIKPNLVQTLENTPALVHGGPFANIAHGCNTVMATKMALKLTDYVVTEAGFGADLGAEKFFDIKCRFASLNPDVVVLVATVRALKMHGGAALDSLKQENVEAVEKGLENLGKHIENLESFGVPVVVAVNKFITDTDAEIKMIKDYAESKDSVAVYSDVWEHGGEGGIELGKAVLDAIENKPSNFKPIYEIEGTTIKEKIETIATKIYGADGVDYMAQAEKDIATYTDLGFDNVPVCMAKTQSSISDDPNLKGAPTGWRLTVREVRLSAGAGFLITINGAIMTMPGLPKKPAAEAIDVDSTGKITGLF